MSNNITEAPGNHESLDGTVLTLIGFVTFVLLIVIAVTAYKRWFDQLPTNRYQPVGDQPSCLRQLSDYIGSFFPKHRAFKDSETANTKQQLLADL